MAYTRLSPNGTPGPTYSFDPKTAAPIPEPTPEVVTTTPFRYGGGWVVFHSWAEFLRQRRERREREARRQRRPKQRRKEKPAPILALMQGELPTLAGRVTARYVVPVVKAGVTAEVPQVVGRLVTKTLSFEERAERKGNTLTVAWTSGEGVGLSHYTIAGDTVTGNGEVWRYLVIE